MFGKRIIEHKCGFIFSKTFVWNIYYSKKNSARYYQMDPLFSPDFKETWIFLADFREILKYQILWKSIQGELCCSMCVDSRRNDRRAVTAIFRNHLERITHPSHKILTGEWRSRHFRHWCTWYICRSTFGQWRTCSLTTYRTYPSKSSKWILSVSFVWVHLILKWVLIILVCIYINTTHWYCNDIFTSADEVKS
jgi:hypothetical protein